MGSRHSQPVRLFCIPHAGSSAAGYLAWQRRLPSWVEVCPLDLPGHGRRSAERLETRVPAMVTSLLQELALPAHGSVAFFGHSLGALLAFELAHELERHSGRRASFLFASGTDAPSRRRGERYSRLSSRADLLAELRRLGGTPAAVLEHSELLELALPLLRADFEACAHYHCPVVRRVSCPIHVFAGADDITTQESLLAWRDHTVAEFSLSVLAGGHFFLRGQEAEVLQQVELHLEQGLSEGGARAWGGGVSCLR